MYVKCHAIHATCYFATPLEFWLTFKRNMIFSLPVSICYHFADLMSFETFIDVSITFTKSFFKLKINTFIIIDKILVNCQHEFFMAGLIIFCNCYQLTKLLVGNLMFSTQLYLFTAMCGLVRLIMALTLERPIMVLYGLSHGLEWQNIDHGHRRHRSKFIWSCSRQT